MSEFHLFILFIFIWSADFVASAHVKGCLGGWFEFTCKNPTYKNKVFVNGNPKAISGKDQWEKEDRLYLYNDTINKNLILFIRDLETKDSENYQCGQTKERNKNEKLPKAVGKWLFIFAIFIQNYCPSLLLKSVFVV